MKTRLSRKFIAMFFTLCIVFSFVSIPTFAAELDFLPQGVTYSKDNKHTYHTQVNVTANVSVKDSTGTVVETTEVSKSSEEFLEGGVGTLQGKLANLQTEIETPYKANGTVTREASATLTSSVNKAIKLTTGSRRCPHPSGIIWAMGGSIFSIFSTIMLLISPMLCPSTFPNGAFRNRSVRRSLNPSNM